MAKSKLINGDDDDDYDARPTRDRCTKLVRLRLADPVAK